MPYHCCVPQAVFLNSGISGFEFLDKIVQVPFCLPNLELRKKQAYLSKMVEERELDPKRVLVRVEHELQEAGMYAPLKPPRSSDDGSNSLPDERMYALVGAAQRMREADLLNDPMRRADERLQPVVGSQGTSIIIGLRLL